MYTLNCGGFMVLEGILGGFNVSGLLTWTGLLVGGFVVVSGLIALALTVIGIVLSLLFFRTRQIVIPGVTLFILNLLEAPIRYLLWAFGIWEDVVSRMIIEVRNILYRERFDKVPYSERALFLPQCLRNPNCPAPLTPEGIRCLNCGRCGIGKIKEASEALGYKFFISPGSSLVKRMVKKYRPKAILGVGCSMEVKEGTSKMASYGLPVQGVLLERDGCVDTRVEVLKLMERIKSSPQKSRKYHIDSDLEWRKKAEEIYTMWGNGDKADVEVINENKKVFKQEKW